MARLLVVSGAGSLLVEKAGVLLLRGVILRWWVEVGTPGASLLLGGSCCSYHASAVFAGMGRVVVVGMPLLSAGLVVPPAAVRGAELVQHLSTLVEGEEGSLVRLICQVGRVAPAPLLSRL